MSTPPNNGIEAIIAHVEALEHAAVNDVRSAWSKVNEVIHNVGWHLEKFSKSAVFLSVAAFVIKLWHHIA